jgi:MFS family permease
VAAADNLRPRSFASWELLAAVVLIGLGAYDIIRDPTAPAVPAAIGRNIPSFALWFVTAVGLFIAHTLIVSGDADRKFIASYERYFDASWKHGVQIVLTGLFVGVFWALLFLGAELFQLVKINFLSDLIRKREFSMPATTLAIAYAIHVTDIRAEIVRGVRTLTLTLLSWLLPMMAAIAVAFLAALIFTGIEPLWSTRRATSVLLLAAGALILLVNAAYQDGDPQRPVTGVLRYAGDAAAGALTILVAIAAYAVVLRVGQYGWTPERIMALAGVAVAACYALGYALAAAASRPWLKWIEVTNIFTAFVILAVMLALFTPVADPARISAADQVARLESGIISPDNFDFAFLRFRSGKYGLDALERLRMKRDNPDAVRIAEKADAILAVRTPFAAQQLPNPATPSERAANIAVIFPKGETLPDTFLNQDWNATSQPWRLPGCMTAKIFVCEAVMLALDGDGRPEILVFARPIALAFKESEGKWNLLGNIENAYCKGVIDALRDGKFELAGRDLTDLRVAGQRLYVKSECR